MLSDRRIGRFTSSQIWKLMTKPRGKTRFSQTALTYIEEVGIERRLGRALNSNISSRPTSWGQAIEPRVAGLLDVFDYRYCSDQTIVHQENSEWAGTPDLIGVDKVGDIKCPYTLKSFVQLADICRSQDVAALKSDFPEYYWQLVSNAILAAKDFAELIVYCPYQRELDEIRESIANLDNTDLQTQAQWIAFGSDDTLPWLPNEGQYTNLNRLKFTIDNQDKDLLTQAIKDAAAQLESEEQ